MRTQAQLDGFEASSGIFPLCAKAPPPAPARMHALRANAPIDRAPPAAAARTHPANTSDISLLSLPLRTTASSKARSDRIPLPSVTSKCGARLRPLQRVRLDAPNKSASDTCSLPRERASV